MTVEELRMEIEEELVQAFKLGMLDALGKPGKPDPIPALRERGSNIVALVETCINEAELEGERIGYLSASTWATASIDGDRIWHEMLLEAARDIQNVDTPEQPTSPRKS